jgi:hypothetical protein
VNDLHRRDGGSSESAPTVSVGIAPAHGARDEERERGRRALLRHVWGALEETERSSGKPLYTVLRLRARHPDLESTELARLASAALGREVTAGNIRVVLHRARARFVDRLLREISHSIESTDPAAIEAELAELRLLEYCRGALRNWCARRAALAGLQRGRPTSGSGSGRGATGRGASGL